MNDVMHIVTRSLTALAIALSLLATAALPARAMSQQEQWELQVGQQQYQQLLSQGKIVRQSPYYAILNPLGRQIASVANRQYFTPFNFILVNDNQPNAFAVPGGNVYVTTAMMTFAQNREELAGVLCHETSHDIHHDVYNLAQKDQQVGLLAGIAGLVLGRNSNLIQSLVGLGANMEALNFSRGVESAADHTGAYTCAQAGFNPWGMVWLFKRFEDKPSGVPLEMLSDHPRDDHRVTDLENTFANDRATFGRYSSSLSASHPLR